VHQSYLIFRLDIEQPAGFQYVAVTSSLTEVTAPESPKVLAPTPIARNSLLYFGAICPKAITLRKPKVKAKKNFIVQEPQTTKIMQNGK
jgi:hypothetical protein